MTASRIFGTPFELADYASRTAVIVHKYCRGNENTAGRLPRAGIATWDAANSTQASCPCNRRVRSDDPRSLVTPVAVAQQALVELSGRQPRQLVLEVDRARHFL